MFISHLVILMFLSLSQGQQNCEPTVTVVNGRKANCKNDVLFDENFNSLDSTLWKKTIRIAGDDYDFVSFVGDTKNSFVRNGMLTIKPTIINDDNYIKTGTLNLPGCTETDAKLCSKTAVSFSILPPVNTAQLCTKDSFSFKYGRITVKAKLPSGDWIMPQIWLKPKEDYYGDLYMSGKIRLASVRGNEELVSSDGRHIGSKLLESGILVASDNESGPIRARTVQYLSTEPWTSSKHEFTLEWTPDNMKFYVDDKFDKAAQLLSNKYKTILDSVGIDSSKNPAWADGTGLAPFDREFYICLGVSVGGVRGFPEGSSSFGVSKPWKNLESKNLLRFFQAKQQWGATWTENTKLEVDSIKVTAI